MPNHYTVLNRISAKIKSRLSRENTIYLLELLTITHEYCFEGERHTFYFYCHEKMVILPIILTGSVIDGLLSNYNGIQKSSTTTAELLPQLVCKVQNHEDKYFIKILNKYFDFENGIKILMETNLNLFVQLKTLEEKGIKITKDLLVKALK